MAEEENKIPPIVTPPVAASAENAGIHLGLNEEELTPELRDLINREYSRLRVDDLMRQFRSMFLPGMLFTLYARHQQDENTYTLLSDEPSNEKIIEHLTKIDALNKGATGAAN